MTQQQYIEIKGRMEGGYPVTSNQLFFSYTEIIMWPHYSELYLSTLWTRSAPETYMTGEDTGKK